MNLHTFHPREQLVAIMGRIYQRGMTTLSGGNLSIREECGDIWVTPAGVDKGQLVPADVMHVAAGGAVSGLHRPSSELPFHRAIYRRRPDLRAIVHAHPPALVSFSLVHQTPDISVCPQARRVCGAVGYAPYALPGSELLGETIANAFAAGHDSVILENHGAVAAGRTLLEAFQRLEALEFCARSLIYGRSLGAEHKPEEGLFIEADLLPELSPAAANQREGDLRQQVGKIAARAYERQLMTSTAGVVSARLDEDCFLITPADGDLATLSGEDVVLVQQGARESGKLPHPAARLHRAIYARHPDIQAVVSGPGLAMMAFAITAVPFHTHTIPESFILLRDVPRVPLQTLTREPESVAEVVSLRTPALLLQNEGMLAVGADLLQAFDRLEVAEFSARALIDTAVLGSLLPISPEDIAAIKQKFC